MSLFVKVLVLLTYVCYYVYGTECIDRPLWYGQHFHQTQFMVLTSRRVYFPLGDGGGGGNAGEGGGGQG
jgi:hypothetical protein